MHLYFGLNPIPFYSQSLASESLSFVADVDSLDWKGLSASEITERVTSQVQPGSIVLFHNAAKHTPEALPGILEFLIAQGYRIVPISECIIKGKYNEDYTIDHTGKQLCVSDSMETKVPASN